MTKQVLLSMTLALASLTVVPFASAQAHHRGHAAHHAQAAHTHAAGAATHTTPRPVR